MLRNRMLLTLSLAVFVAYAGTAMIVPVRVLYAQDHGASLAIIGAMATSFLISNFIFQYPVGALADRWGRKRIMLIGLVAQAIISLLYLPISDPIMFVALRFVEGMFAAMLIPPARALIADNTPLDKRGEAYGLFGAFFNASFLLGPALGSLLAGVGYTPVFIGSVVARLIALVMVALLVNERPAHGVAATEQRAVSLRALLSLPLLGAYILTFGDFLYLGFDQTIFPLWMRDNLGGSVQMIGLVYIFWSFPTIIISPFAGKIADRRRRSALIIVFGLLQVPVYLAYGLVSVAWPVLALALLHGVFFAMMQPAVDAHLAAAAPEYARARAQGFYSAVGLVGAFVAANGFVPLYEADFRLPLFVMGAIFGLCVIGGGLLIRTSEDRGLVSVPQVAAGTPNAALFRRGQARPAADSDTDSRSAAGPA